MKKLLLVITAVSVLSGAVFAAVLRVPTEYSTIQAAVSAASIADTVSVAPGTYNEHIEVNIGICIIGDDMYTTIIDAGGSSRCITIPNVPNSVGQISGFTFTNTGRGTYSGYACAGVCIHTAGSGTWEISGNIFKDNPDIGILSFDGSLITRNIFENNGNNGNYGRGIMASSYSHVVVLNNSFRLNNEAIYKHAGGVSIDVRNNIIVENHTGISISGTGATIDYNDVYNNGSNYSNCPAGAHDISTDPLFVGGTNYDYNLTSNSPCIDAGDPNSPLDPDGTIADMGALYHDRSRLMLSLTPHNTPIQIPAGGGTFTFDATINNNSSDPITFDAWTMVILPNSVNYGPMIQRTGLFAAPGASIMRVVVQNVPGVAPPGNYTYVGNIGVYPDSIVFSEDFPFTKMAGDAPPAHNLGWTTSGWDDNPVNTLTTERLTDLSVNPNPFNCRSLISFTLETEGLVTLAVYDVNGREIVNLAQGLYPAGTHQVPWDASRISSGIYFARLQAGNITRTEKLMLVK